MIRWPVYVLAAALAWSPFAAGVEFVNVTGTLTFEKAEFSGRTTLDGEGVDAAHWGAVGTLLAGSWALRAETAVVNWTGKTYTAVGQVGDDPTEGYVVVGETPVDGQRTFDRAEISSVFASAKASFLLEPGTALQATAQAPMAAVAPGDGRVWSTGRVSNASVGNDGATQVHRTASGQPLVYTMGPATWEIRGDFTLYAWGVNVTVQAGNQSIEEYPSGASWSDPVAPNPLAPHGVAREKRVQLLRIEVTNSTLSWDHTHGQNEWTAQAWQTKTVGGVTFSQTRGTLHAQGVAYEASDDTVVLDGEVHQRIQQGPRAEALTGEVEGQAAGLELLAIHRAGSTASPAWWLVAAALAIVGAAGWWVAARRNPWSPEELVDRGHQALAAHQPRRARAWARRALRKDEGLADAWFVYGVSLQEENRHRSVVKRIERATHKVRDQTGLAFLLALSWIRLGDLDRAVKHLRSAVQDPDFAQAVWEDDTFAPLRHLVLAPRRAVSNPAYG